MKTTFKIFALTALFFGFATVSFAQNTATESSTIGARIIAPIGLANNQGLEFGDIIKAAGTVTIAPAAGTGDDVRTASPTAMIQVTGTRTPQAAKFTASGESGFSFKIAVPTTNIEITSGSNKITVNNFKVSDGSTSATLGGRVLGTDDVFYVGADLIVTSSTVIGVYSGTFDVTVTYE